MSSQKQYKEEWKKQLVKCIRCGTCRSVCPVFKEENNENTTARGKVRLLEAVSEGVVELTPDLQERFAKCLMCKACVKGCPSGVRTDELFLSARQATAEKNGLPFVKRVAFTGLRYRKLFDLGLRLGSVFQGLVMKRTADGRGAIPRVLLPGAGLNLRRVIPPLAEQPLRSMLPERLNVAQPKGTVAFFTGCMLNYIYPQAGKAIVRLLERNGWNVVLPEAQCCCGTPALNSLYSFDGVKTTSPLSWPTAIPPNLIWPVPSRISLESITFVPNDTVRPPLCYYFAHLICRP